MAINSKLPKNLLVARFSALGDVAMTIPVVYSACRCNPATRFIFITKPGQTGLFVNPPENLVVLGIDVNEKYRSGADLFRLFRELRSQYGIDGFADLHGVLRTFMLGIACSLHGVKWRTIRKGRMNKRALTRPRNKIMLPLLSSRARYREVFYGFGYVLEEKFKSIYGDGKGDPALFASVTAPKGSAEKWIGIAPFAKHKGKIYPVELMEKVVEELSSQPDTKIFLFGGGEHERKVLDRWASSYPSVVSLAGRKLGFAVELALLSHLDTVVSMDSANMHLASLVNVRVVSIWGATHPYCGFKGFRQRERDIVQLPMTCRPCSVFGNKPCSRGDYHCLAGIPPHIIVNKVNSIVNKNR